MPKDKEFRRDHTRAEIYFSLRNALWILGIDEVEKIYQQAAEDEEANAGKHA